MKRMLKIFIIAVIAVSTAFTSCSKEKPYAGHPILGTWYHYNFLGPFYTYYTFNADATGTYKTVWTNSSSLNTTKSFTYTINGTSVKLTYSGSSSMASEIYYNSGTGVFYDTRYTSLLYTKQ